MKVEIIDDKLVITLPIKNPPLPSKTGKSLVVATTNGNQPTAIQIQGKLLAVGVNAFIKAG